MIEKEKSIEYWNTVSKQWKKMVYNTDKPALIFPSSQLRQEIVLNEIRMNVNKDAKILDIGCADGSLIIQLLKEGYNNVKGIDNSPKMIQEACLQLKKNDFNRDDIFFVGDADNYYTDEKFDVVIAMGLIEYVFDLDDFFGLVYNLLNKNGIAYIESKNKLFNLFSANDYTINTENKEQLIRELDEIKYLSPKKVEDVVYETYKGIGLQLKEINEDKKEDYERYPFNLPQYSPKELINYFKNKQLSPKKIIYYHCHPFPPRYNNGCIGLFNDLSLLMQPLGYTPVGALICSAYVMVIKNE